MRFAVMLWALAALAGCAIPTIGEPSATTVTSSLVAAEAATALAVGERITLVETTHPAPRDSGQDPLIILQVRHVDGRTMSFEAANHAPNHVMAQAPGGPLAQIMGLFGEEAPMLFTARAQEHRGTPFICGRDGGPVAIGVYSAPDGAVQIIGLKQEIAFEMRSSGTAYALPYSPDQVCARLSFRLG